MVNFTIKIKSKTGEITEQTIYLVPRARKVVALTEKLKTKSLSDAIFKGFNDGSLTVLAEAIKAFAEKEDGTQAFYSMDNVYDFIDDYVNEKECSYSALYEDVIKVTNEMGFLKSKMDEKTLKIEMDNPLSAIDMTTIIANSAEKAVINIAEEEFKGYKG